MTNYFGGMIEFNDDIEKDIESITKQTALLIIEASITYGLKNGLYDLSESYILYKCMSKLKENEE